MKNKDLSNAIGNINLKYVEEAENFTAKRMSLTKIVSLAACIAILVTAIPAALILNREAGKTDAPIVTTPLDGEVTDPGNDADKKFVQIIYCDAKSAEEIKKASQNKDIEIKDISEIETNLSTKVGDIEASAEIPARLYKTIGEKEYTFKFSSAYSTVLSTSSNEQRRKDGSVAVYGVEGKELGETRMEYCYESEKIITIQMQSFYDSCKAEGDLTADQAKLLADRDLAVIYGNDFSQTYTYENSELIKLSSETKYFYSVEYRRMICGYPTNEAIRAAYNLQGELIYIATDNLGSFDHINDSLTIENILEAEAKALELLGDAVIETKKLSADKDGNVYVYIAYTSGYTFELYFSVDGSTVKARMD